VSLYPNETLPDFMTSFNLLFMESCCFFYRVH
jgi:hypothetical protein